MQTFSEGEMQRRLDGVRGLMDRLDLRAVVTTSLHGTLYYSNFWMVPFGRVHAAVIPREGKPAIIAPLIEHERPGTYSWFEDVRIYADTASAGEGAARLVAEVLADNGVADGRIGVEEDHISVQLLNRLRAALPAFAFADASEAMMRQRLVKSEEEIALIRQGAEISDLGGWAFVDAVAEGVTEFEVARAAVAAMEREIARRFPDVEVDATWCWCQSGVDRTTLAHAPNTSRRLGAGDLLSLNCFPIIAGYYHALERSIVFGPVSEAVRRPFEVNCEAHEAGIRAIGPGIRCSEIDGVIDPIYEKAGLLGHRTFGYGHSFGILGQWYGREEGGELRPYNDTVISEGMVVSMEPMIAVPGVGGFRHHDILLVTADGNEVLTRFPRGLLTIEGLRKN